MRNGAWQLVLSYEGCVVLQVEQVKQHSTECLAVSGKDECLEATVASLDHPGCFWVQVR